MSASRPRTAVAPCELRDARPTPAGRPRGAFRPPVAAGRERLPPRRPAPHLAPSTRWRLLWPSRSRRSVSCVYHVHDAQPLFFPRLPAPIPFLFLSSPWAFFPRIPFLSLSLPFIRSFLPLIPSSNSLSPSLSLLLIALLSALQTPRGMGQRLRCCLTRWRR